MCISRHDHERFWVLGSRFSVRCWVPGSAEPSVRCWVPGSAEPSVRCWVLGSAEPRTSNRTQNREPRTENRFKVGPWYGHVTGVLLMAHGTPSSLDEMPEYLRLVRGGRPPSPELIAEMRHNYEAIGGRSPLTDLTLAQADALSGVLGPDVPVVAGMRNWRPFIKRALADLASRGVDRAIGIPLA